MLCQHCNQKEATTHIRKSVNGVKEEHHLCSECAEKLGFTQELKMPSMNELLGDTILGSFLGSGVASMHSLAGVERCQSCGSSFNDIVKTGRIGCADCYNMFGERLAPSIKKIHGKAKHIGKYVTYSENEEKQPKDNKGQLENLKEELKQAIADQRFEDAAVIRDKINELQENGNE